MAVFTNATKNSATWLNYLAHGKETILNDMANMKFTDVVFEDGTTLQNVTFNQLVAQVWTNATKNTAVYTNATKN